jgi:hypothetical protein
MKTVKNIKKTANKKATTIDFSDSVTALKSTAKSINTSAKKIADEVMEDLSENKDQIKEYTIVPVKKVYNKVKETVTMDNLSKATKKVNDYTLKTAEEMVEGAIGNGEKLQVIAQKAIKGGLKLSAKQQTIVFDALEAVKGQMSYSTNRFKKLFK